MWTVVRYERTKPGVRTQSSSRRCAWGCGRCATWAGGGPAHGGGREANGPYTAMEGPQAPRSRSSSTCSRRWPPPAGQRYDADGVPLDRRPGAVESTGRWPRREPTGWAGVVTHIPGNCCQGWGLRCGPPGPPGPRPTAIPPGSCRSTSTPSGWCRRAGCSRSTTDPRVLVGGVVLHRQRPATASASAFIDLEDETGLINVVCSRAVGPVPPGGPLRPGPVGAGPAREGGGGHQRGGRTIDAMPLSATVPSRDFR